MKCEYCGRILQPGETVCPGCGATIENPEPIKQDNEDQSGKIEVKVNGVNISIGGLGNKNTGSNGPINMGQQAAANTANSSHTSQSQVPPVPPMQSVTPGYTGNNPQMMQQAVEYGGFWRRVVAHWIDWFIIIFTCSFGVGIILVFIYYPLCEAYWNGSTIGKKAMGLKVVNANMEPISIGQAFGRYFAKILCYVTCYIGFLMVAFSSQKRGLHDRIADTYVIRVR